MLQRPTLKKAKKPGGYNKMVKVGVIGTGAMGRHHVRVYSEMENVEIVGISDVDQRRVKEIAEKYDTTPFTDYRDLLNSDLDACSVVVPTSMHKDVALDVIDSGTNLLIEKPIADTLENADMIIKAAKDAKVKLVVGHIERFNPAVVKLKEIIDRGVLGEIVSISARRVGPFNDRIRDVGVIIDLGVHDIDVISYLYNREVKDVFAIAGNGIRPFEDRASILLRYGENCSGLIETNWLTPHKVRKLTLIGLGGMAYLDYINQTVELHVNNQIEQIDVDAGEPLRNELEHFVDVIGNGHNSHSSGENGRYVLNVAMAAKRSYKEGYSITV